MNTPIYTVKNDKIFSFFYKYALILNNHTLSEN